MNEMQDTSQPEVRLSQPAPQSAGMSNMWKAIVVVLAVIGVLALIAVGGMFLMHGSMMGGMGMGRR